MKRNISFLTFSLILLGIAMQFTSCVKDEYDTPPIDELPVGEVLTIADLRQMFNESGAHEFTGDSSLLVTVTMGESTGNIYESAYVKDSTGSINLHFQSTNGLEIGDYIQVYLKGCNLNIYNNLLQVDGLHADSNIIIKENNRQVLPTVATINEIKNEIDTYEARLVKIENVQFVQSELGETYSEEDQSTNRMLTDCDGDQLIVRTSSYSNFADELLPEGNGSIVGIIGRFYDDAQLYIRTLDDVKLDGERCDAGGGGGGGGTIDPVNKVEEEFTETEVDVDIALEGWSNIIEAGDRAWQGKEFDNNKYAQASAYNSGLSEMITWLITPPVINDEGKKVLSFESAKAYWEHNDDSGLTVWVSTDFTGDNFASATWTQLDATIASEGDADHEWIPSGDISLADYQGNCAIAFRYRGSDTESTSFRIDNVMITSEGGGDGSVFFENFNSDISTFSKFSVTGEQEWSWSGTLDDGAAKMTGYDGSAYENEDWLISPAIDLSNNTGSTVNINQAVNFLDGQWDEINVMISSDYDGTSDPSLNGTWEELTVTNQPTGNSFEFVDSGDIDISDYDSEGSVYIAFKYLSSTSNTPTWAISSIGVY
ncbi:MAG: DUF5689 domain-containing protein [Bacteroidales bacterium]|nr:DUF5689 domain-containing protein [Bacteroidales bacterium]